MSYWKNLIDRQLGKGVIEAEMNKIWRLSAMANFREVGSNTFLVSFATHAKRLSVENGRPWLFDGHIFILESYNGNTKLKDLNFNLLHFGYNFMKCLSGA